MTPVTYKRLRTSIGTQEAVAALLQVSRTTVARRENGSMPITEEAALAIQKLHCKQTKKESK